MHAAAPVVRGWVEVAVVLTTEQHASTTAVEEGKFVERVLAWLPLSGLPVADLLVTLRPLAVGPELVPPVGDLLLREAAREAGGGERADAALTAPRDDVTMLRP